MVDFDFKSENLDQKLRIVRSKAVRLSSLRVLGFFMWVAFLILGISEHFLWFIPAGFIGWFFLWLIQQFNAAKDQESIYLALQSIEERKKSRKDRMLSGLEEGMEFADKTHPFSGDLDLFGAHSLFQLINHTTSEGGRQKLADLLKADFETQQAKMRQSGVRELTGKPEFLQSQEAVGLAFSKESGSKISWEKWIDEPERVSAIHWILALLGPLGGMTWLILIWFGLLPQAWLGAWIILGVLVLSRVFQPLKKAADHIPSTSQMKSMALRSQMIEEEKFDSTGLCEAQSPFTAGGKPISAQIRNLDRLGLWVQNRLNLLYLPFNLLFWTDFILLLSLSKWKKKAGTSLRHLPEYLQEWEVWVSLGSFEVEVGYPGTVTWTEETILSADQIVHPLIHPEKAIANSCSLGANPKLILLTGANMSGKTTFMRTLGINAVIVNLGLRPFAKELVIGPFQLYTSMRNADNLGESVSSFYAELHRIKSLIGRLESGERIFFLLDEILKGTNTQDRISGSKALIHQILQTPGFGMISTHDIELSELGKTEESIRNFSFHSEIRDETIQFDYKLKKGPCPSFNAHKLMELMGIRFEGN